MFFTPVLYWHGSPLPPRFLADRSRAAIYVIIYLITKYLNRYFLDDVPSPATFFLRGARFFLAIFSTNAERAGKYSFSHPSP